MTKPNTTNQQDALQTLNADLSFDERLRLGREANLVLGVWEDMDDQETGLGHMVVKGSDILRNVLMEGEQPSVKQLTLPCANKDEATVLAYVLDQRPLDGKESSAYLQRHVAQGVEGNGTAVVKHNWRATPQRQLLRCIAAKLYKDGERGGRLVEHFKRLVPDYARQFDGPVSDKAIVQRGDCAWRYENENPTTKARPYWEQAVKIVEGDEPVDMDEVVKKAGLKA